MLKISAQDMRKCEDSTEEKKTVPAKTKHAVFQLTVYG
jgi:hypothetical protein